MIILRFDVTYDSWGGKLTAVVGKLTVLEKFLLSVNSQFEGIPQILSTRQPLRCKFAQCQKQNFICGKLGGQTFLTAIRPMSLLLFCQILTF